MKFELILTEEFKKNFKKPAKKYPSLPRDIREVVGRLSINPKEGTSFGSGLYKIRLRIWSKRKGKRGGGKAITFLIERKKRIYFLPIFDKSDLVIPI